MKKILIIVASLGLMACEKRVEPLAPPRPALVVIVGQVSNSQEMILVGEVKSRFETNLGFRINGKIIERTVDVGAFVKKGQVIARLDAVDANFSAAAALADVRSAEASHELTLAEVKRQRTLFNKKFISASALDLSEAELKTSQARLQQVKAQAAVSNNQSRYTALVANKDGVVTQINAEPGQVVTAGTMIAQVADHHHLEVLVAVPESRLTSLKIGEPVTVKLWAQSEANYEGSIREIAPAANSATRAFDVRVQLLNADNAVKLGMTAGVRFVHNNLQKDFIIPSTAVTQIKGKTSVWVIDKSPQNPIGVANPRVVNVNQYTEQGAIVTSGLQAGEMVAVAGVHTLVKGQKVKPSVVTP